MANGCISLDRILSKLDGYLHKNDYASAERHLRYWLAEAESVGDVSTEVFIRNEMMGLLRKLGRKQEALAAADAALRKVTALQIGQQVGGATTLLNCATVYKAFGLAEQALPLYEQTREVYERSLQPEDNRLAGLYNNMALAMVDLKRYQDANVLYQKAIAILERTDGGAPDIAITCLNMANAAEAEQGFAVAEPFIAECLTRAKQLLETYPKQDGYYAFVCEKCASVYGYYGQTAYAKELLARSERIYGQ